MSEKPDVETKLKNLNNLRKLINDYFTVEELKLLCFDLGVDFDNFLKGSKESIIVDLIKYFQRNGRLEELLALLSGQRPHVSWPNIKLNQRRLISQLDETKISKEKNVQVGYYKIIVGLLAIIIIATIVLIIIQVSVSQKQETVVIIAPTATINITDTSKSPTIIPVADLIISETETPKIVTESEIVSPTQEPQNVPPQAAFESETDTLAINPTLITSLPLEDTNRITYSLTTDSIQAIEKSTPVPLSSLNIDGIRGDWQSFTPKSNDSENDTLGDSHTDIKSVFFETDDSYAYFLVELWDSLSEKKSTIEINLILIHDEDFRTMHSNFHSDGSFFIGFDNDGDQLEEEFVSNSRTQTAWGENLEIKIPMNELGNPEQINIHGVHFWTSINNQWMLADESYP